MRIDDLDLRELLHFDPKGGIVRFAGERAIILDSVAIGLLRRELIDTLGSNVARGVLTRFGFSHGWRTAESLKTALPWETEREWRIAGGRLHRLQGIVFPDIIEPKPTDENPPFAEAIWRESYEAEQHLLHLGRSERPVCWTLCGFASGYLSYANSRPIYAIELRCLGRGDACCHMVARTQEDWGAAFETELHFYQPDSLDEALRRITEALKKTEKRLRASRRVSTGGRLPELSPDFVARSDGMMRVIEMALRVSRVDATVLLLGESGVGKERVARLVHDESARAGGPFLAVNCAAIAESLLESELFGHVRGAFTGANQDRIGLFEAANGGTLFLDEIGELPSSTQAKLLRVLQEREIRRVGESRSRAINVRIIAATNRDLAELVQAQQFREDLYYRLSVVQIRVPPLRERQDDILPLARLFLDEAAERFGLPVTALTPEAMTRLLRHEWPGNVRELKNAVDRAAIMTTGNLVEASALPEWTEPPIEAPRAPDAVRTLADVERDYILAALEAFDRNREQTARALGIGVATLYRRLRAYRQEEPEKAWRDSASGRGGERA